MGAIGGSNNVSKFRTRPNPDDGADAAETVTGASPKMELWHGLYRQAVGAEERLRAILPYTQTSVLAEQLARSALKSIADLSEFLLRERAHAERREQERGEGGATDGLWSVNTVAEWTGLSDDKVRKMVDTGVLPHVMMDGVLRIPAARLLALVDAGIRYGRS